MIRERPIASVESAGRAIGGVFPELRGSSVELLDEGWDFRVFVVDQRWVFRFPKRKASVPKLLMERRLLSDLERFASLPVPVYECFSEATGMSDWPFGGYRKLPGVGGDVARKVNRLEVARQLGTFLGELHSYPVSQAREAGVQEPSNLVSYWRNTALAQLREVDVLQANRLRLQEFLEKDVPVSPEGTACLVHGDLWALHVLLDSRSGKATGILDWGDAVIGDRAIDFACLYTWYGEPWVKEVLEHYTEKLDAEVIPRAKYLATCVAIHCITLGREWGRTQWIDDGLAALKLTAGDGDWA